MHGGSYKQVEDLLKNAITLDVSKLHTTQASPEYDAEAVEVSFEKGSSSFLPWQLSLLPWQVARVFC
jgi:hypothetical protein